MRALDYLEPLPVHRPDEALAAVLGPLEHGTPVAYADARGWRLVRPIDAVAFPATRQLCDLPSRKLPLLSLHQDVDLASLAENEVWGCTRHSVLVGRLDSLRVLSLVAAGPDGDAEETLAVAARDRLMPKLLHDLSNALTVAGTVYELPEPEPLHLAASAEAVRHASALVLHMRALYAGRNADVDKVWGLADVLAEMESMLQVAARPAQLTVVCDQAAPVRGQRWRLESALLNLVLNASEQADDVRVSVTSAGRQRIELRVEDDGPGFADPAVLEGDGERRSSLHGHGLPSIRRQVVAMGGRLRIERSPLGGALVRIHLPRAW